MKVIYTVVWTPKSVVPETTGKRRAAEFLDVRQRFQQRRRFRDQILHGGIKGTQGKLGNNDCDLLEGRCKTGKAYLALNVKIHDKYKYECGSKRDPADR